MTDKESNRITITDQNGNLLVKSGSLTQLGCNGDTLYTPNDIQALKGTYDPDKVLDPVGHIGAFSPKKRDLSANNTLEAALKEFDGKGNYFVVNTNGKEQLQHFGKKPSPLAIGCAHLKANAAAPSK